MDLDPVALKILKELKRQNLASCELKTKLKLSDTGINENLAYLKNKKEFIVATKEYVLNSDNVQQSRYKITPHGSGYLHACWLESIKTWYPHVIATIVLVVAIIALFKP